MFRWSWLALVGALLLAPRVGAAQEDVVVLIVDPGETRMSQARLQAAIAEATQRSIIRMTDDRAPGAHGRLTIAFSRPNRWVLRYEARGQVAWVSDRIAGPSRVRQRLAELSRGLVTMVDGQPAPRPSPSAPRAAPASAEPHARWDDVILALQDEIIDPFEGEPPPRERPVTVLWSEVVDPFTDHRATRASVGEVWSEVMDPWAPPAPRR